MTVCAALGCRNIGGHKFPRNHELREKWLNALQRKGFIPSKTSVLCAAHFRREDYSTECYTTGDPLINKTLKKNTVPSIFNNIQQGTKVQRGIKRKLTTPPPLERKKEYIPNVELVKQEIISDDEETSDSTNISSDNGEGYIDPLFEEDQDESEIMKRVVTMLEKQKDEFSSFGEFVAHELRCINSSILKKKLKQLIQKAILDIVEEEEKLRSLESS